MKRLTKKYSYGYLTKYERETKENYYDLVFKLGQLEDIEEEIGIDLITLFKALKNGVYYIGAWGTQNNGKITYTSHPELIYEKANQCLCFKGSFFDFLYFEDYGKTWALTMEELEDEEAN